MDMDRIVEAVLDDRTSQATGEDMAGIGILPPEVQDDGMAHTDDKTLADTWRSMAPMGNSYKDAAPDGNGNWVVGKQMTRAELVDHIVSHRMQGRDGAPPAHGGFAEKHRTLWT